MKIGSPYQSNVAGPRDRETPGDIPREKGPDGVMRRDLSG